MTDPTLPRDIKGPDDLPENCLIPEVAQYFRQTEKTIRLWVNRGYFPHAFKPGRNILIPKQDVIDYAHERYGNR